MNPLLAFFPGMGIGPMEMMIVGVIALLLFGKRLPEVARSMGKGIVEFKKGLSGIEEELNSAARRPAPAATSAPRPAPEDDRTEVTAPKFEPPTAEPADVKPA